MRGDSSGDGGNAHGAGEEQCSALTGLLTRRVALTLGAASLAAAGSARADTVLTSNKTPFLPVTPRVPNSQFPAAPSWETGVRQLAPNVYAYTQGGGPGRSNVGLSNAMFIVGDEGILLVDSLAAPLHTKPMVEAIRKVTDKPFKFIVNTHHHGDHLNGNQFVPDHPQIISSPYCRQEVLADGPGPAYWEKREGWARGDEPRKILPATITIENKTTLHVGGTVVEVLPMIPAHTYGDLVVYLPQHAVMAVGDIGFFGIVPFLINSNPSEWVKVCDRIGAMNVDYIVPGHGPVGGKAELAEMADYLRLLRMEARKRYDARLTAAATAADISLGKYESWIGPEQIVANVVRFFMEFDGTLTPAANPLAVNSAIKEYNSIVLARGRG